MSATGFCAGVNSCRAIGSCSICAGGAVPGVAGRSRVMGGTRPIVRISGGAVVGPSGMGNSGLCVTCTASRIRLFSSACLSSSRIRFFWSSIIALFLSNHEEAFVNLSFVCLELSNSVSNCDCSACSDELFATRSSAISLLYDSWRSSSVRAWWSSNSRLRPFNRYCSRARLSVDYTHPQAGSSNRSIPGCDHALILPLFVFVHS